MSALIKPVLTGWELVCEAFFLCPARSLDFSLGLSSLEAGVFLMLLEDFSANSVFDAGLSSLPAGPSSDETESGDALREDEEDNGSGEPSEEL